MTRISTTLLWLLVSVLAARLGLSALLPFADTTEPRYAEMARLHHLRHTRGFHSKVAAPAGQFSYLFNNIRGLAIERVGGTQFPGQLKATVVNIHGNNVLATGNTGSHDRTQADRTTPINHNA